MTEQCPRLGKLFRGCKFEARYDITEPDPVLSLTLSIQWALSESDKDRLVKTSTYVHDICTTCGKIITNE